MKKISRLWIFSLVLTLAVGFSSCSKDDDDDAPAADPTSVLVANDWELDEIEPQNVDANTSVALQLIVALSEANYLSFEADGDLEYSTMVEETGKWSLSSDNKTLTIKDSEGAVVSSFTIVEAKSTLLKLKKKYTKAETELPNDVDVVLSFIPVEE